MEHKTHTILERQIHPHSENVRNKGRNGMVKQRRMLLVPFASLKCNKDPALKRTTNDDQAKPINISRSLRRDARALSSQKPLKKFLKVKP